MPILGLDALHDKMNILENEIQTCKQGNIIDDRLIISLVDVLNWIGIIYQNTSLPKNDPDLLAAHCAANNIKHNQLLKLEEHTAALFPSDDLYPSESLYPKEFSVVWGEVKEVRHHDQYDAYNQYWKGNDVVTVLNRIVKKLETAYIAPDQEETKNLNQ